MKPLVKDVLNAVDTIAPWHLSEPWDNSGLQIGDPEAAVTRIAVSLDVTPFVLDEAIALGIDCLITHHPFFFKPIKNLDFSTVEGKIIKNAAKSGISIISAHTNFDIAVMGLNDALAEKMGLTDIRPMISLKGKGESEQGAGIGRIGNLPYDETFKQFAFRLKSCLGLSHIRCVGDLGKSVKTVALCTGSGGSLINDFFACGADVYVSGDLKYHEARDTEARGKAFVDIGHFGSEILMVDIMSDRLKNSFMASGYKIEVIAIRSEKEPFEIL